ncbi:unnamed protein product [Chondrus crispus]|uniref:Uncharacterized protein n=1 Tax=Chondrus crispus TaxID=2769 RepID=R7Q4Q1_CHOCR|nr:unnamed protein product [Chondrus crispus]CDF32356.1 unnamed protein product [Chondrus crispus]|eukprot:XP_005712021.1 unnamed protein product [Chondrus crispus]
MPRKGISKVAAPAFCWSCWRIIKTMLWFGHEEATFETLCCARGVAERDLGLVAGEEEDLAHERQREGAFGTGGKGNIDGHFV